MSLTEEEKAYIKKEEELLKLRWNLYVNSCLLRKTQRSMLIKLQEN
ncbi:MAG: hypothetical protein CM1200mP16_10320 [Nitrospina sp.]|nr:MAG: hypothetical protein CM1200mP16_10320 [Nitrospina sp.]